jgi:uncharacterized protein (TIGR02145 family)
MITFHINQPLKKGGIMSLLFAGRGYGRVLLLAAAVAVGFVGCGEDWGGGNNNCTSDGTCKKVTIGGVTWLAENLNVNTTGSMCYENSNDSCAKYGRLYTWSAAKSACQSIGWRLPDTADWRHLLETVGGVATAGVKLRAKSWDDGTDNYGFSALPGGKYDNICYASVCMSFQNAGYNAYFWEDDYDDSGSIWVINYSDQTHSPPFYVYGAFSARCVRD